jgi:GT2 family glycosyltransferase
MNFDVPVLLITFNRPDTTAQVLEAIKLIVPEKLYVFSDAPREGNLDDLRKVSQVRDLFRDSDPNIKIETNFQSQNLGCAKGVTTAINWAFEKEDQLIILEDDCLPSQSFFLFCKTMLQKFRDDARVMHIAGTRWNDEYGDNTSIHFSSVGHIWGWATWKRAWSKYDFTINDWKENVDKVHARFRSKVARQFWKEAFRNIHARPVKHTWDYQWQYTLFKFGGLAVMPDKNLISNIGVLGVHNHSSASETRNNYLFNREVYDWHFVNEPEAVQVDPGYDDYHMMNHFMRWSTKYATMKMKIKYYLNV